jgi:hypothetical protein
LESISANSLGEREESLSSPSLGRVEEGGGERRANFSTFPRQRLNARALFAIKEKGWLLYCTCTETRVEMLSESNNSEIYFQMFDNHFPKNLLMSRERKWTSTFAVSRSKQASNAANELFGESKIDLSCADLMLRKFPLCEGTSLATRTTPLGMYIFVKSFSLLAPVQVKLVAQAMHLCHGKTGCWGILPLKLDGGNMCSTIKVRQKAHFACIISPVLRNPTLC